MKISTKGRYAIRVLLDLAEHNNGEFIPLMDIANRQEISEKYLESIVNTLVRSGFVTGLRGKGGGYRLSRPADQIVVYDVLTSTEGTLVPVACLDRDSKPCARMSGCQTLPLWKGLNEVVTDYLNRFTVQDLMRQSGDGFDYVI